MIQANQKLNQTNQETRLVCIEIRPDQSQTLIGPDRKVIQTNQKLNQTNQVTRLVCIEIRPDQSQTLIG
ncbi:MAG: hypothetical protein ACP5G5_06245, partial [Thermoplasmata archaeon]